MNRPTTELADAGQRAERSLFYLGQGLCLRASRVAFINPYSPPPDPIHSNSSANPRLHLGLGRLSPTGSYTSAARSCPQPVGLRTTAPSSANSASLSRKPAAFTFSSKCFRHCSFRNRQHITASGAQQPSQRHHRGAKPVAPRDFFYHFVGLTPLRHRPPRQKRIRWLAIVAARNPTRGR